MPSATTEADSETGWSDIPSDAEDVFFLAPEDIEDYERSKRKHAIEKLREERLRAMEEDGDEIQFADESEKWGGSDEEPDEEQKEVMRRTAAHILSSSNAAQLEMRILTNYGANPRFAFLRGRWSRSWAIIKAQVKYKRSGGNKGKSKENASLGGLMAYTGSESESGGDEEDAEASTTDRDGKRPPAIIEPVIENGEAIKEARRARAREWAKSRRAEKSNSE